MKQVVEGGGGNNSMCERKSPTTPPTTTCPECFSFDSNPEIDQNQYFDMI